MKKGMKDIRELKGIYKYLEEHVIGELNLHYSYNGKVPENILHQVKKELKFIKETKIAGVFFYASRLMIFAFEKGIFNPYDELCGNISVMININIDVKWVAYFMGVTDSYSLPLHYHCWRCGFSDFENVENVTTGKELPKRLCPNCEYELDRWGALSAPQKQIEITDVMHDAIIEMTFPIANKEEILNYANCLIGEENRNFTGVKLYFK